MSLKMSDCIKVETAVLGLKGKGRKTVTWKTGIHCLEIAGRVLKKKVYMRVPHERLRRSPGAGFPTNRVFSTTPAAHGPCNISQTCELGTHIGKTTHCVPKGAWHTATHTLSWESGSSDNTPLAWAAELQKSLPILQKAARVVLCQLFFHQHTKGSREKKCKKTNKKTWFF